MELALRGGQQVVIKPHLEPVLYRPGYQRALSDNHSWRAECGWRGLLRRRPHDRRLPRGGGAVRAAHAQAGVRRGWGRRWPRRRPVRFDLGAELMNSMVEFPEGWERLLRAAAGRAQAAGPGGPGAAVAQLLPPLRHPRGPGGPHEPPRAQGAGPLRGRPRRPGHLPVHGPHGGRPRRRAPRPPAAACPPPTRWPRRCAPTSATCAGTSCRARWGCARPRSRPFTWASSGWAAAACATPTCGAPSARPSRSAPRAREVARGHEGLVRYLSQPQGRTARSAVLWVTGTHFDIFGWRNPAWAIPAASAAIAEYLKK